MMSVSVAGIPKNRCRTTIAERMVETLAELPFIGDQVGCLGRNQAARSVGRDKVSGARGLKAHDPKHLGARIGLTAVLHTWGSALTHHPHAHIIVPGGGVSP